MKSELILFPTRIWKSRVGLTEAQTKSLARECEKFCAIDEQGQRWSKKRYPGGYTSYGSITDLHLRSSSFAALAKKIDAQVAQYLKRLEADVKPKDLVLSSLWINIMGKNCHHSFHLHPLSMISGTVYLQTPKKSSGIKFEDPRIMGLMAAPPKKNQASLSNQTYVELKPQAGDVVLFESWLKHEVPMNQTATPRISVSFNYDWKY